MNDEERTRAIAARLIESHGYEVTIAADGADAIERLAKDHFDAVILDVVMPRVDGRGVLVHLARTNPTMIGRTVLIASAFSEATAAQLDEVCRVLVKPVPIAQLIDAIDECVAA